MRLQHVQAESRAWAGRPAVWPVKRRRDVMRTVYGDKQSV